MQVGVGGGGVKLHLNTHVLMDLVIAFKRSS